MKLITDIRDTISVILKNRNIMTTLVISDFRSRYLNSFIGLPWAFIQPAMYVLVIWFAFTYGLRAGNTDSGFPFGAWLIVGTIPWLFISQTMIVSCMAINEYAYLIKKTRFPVSLIPIIKIFSGMIVHFSIIVCVGLLLMFSYNIPPTIYWIQIIYYLFATTVLLTGISLFVASVNVFIKDMAHIINIIVTMLFWATPIIWPYKMLEGSYRYVALFNPFFYITEGYRYTFLEQRWFYEFPEMNLFFWTITALFLIIGVLTFQKLRPTFGDEL